MSTKKVFGYGTRNLFFATVVCTLAFAALSLTGCENPTDAVTTPPVTGGSGSAITYTATQTGGVNNTATTTAIVFTFSASVDSLGLTAADITVGGTATKVPTALSGTGTTRTLAITVNSAGTATVTIAKTGIETGTKHVTVYKAGQSAPTLSGITAVYTQTATVYPTTPLNDLKAGLTVKAQYSNSTEETLSAGEYALSGTLTIGTRTVTVTYLGKTTAFTVTVSAISQQPGAAVGTPAVASTTGNSITVQTVVPPGNGQSVEYNISAANNNAGLGEWQSGTTFSGLNILTEYYVYARSKENNTHHAGTPSVSNAIMTDPNRNADGLSEQTAYKVYDAATLQKVGKNAIDGWTLTACYEQIADIDMTGQNWTPIGDGSNRFKGAFNGNGHKIKGLHINDASLTTVGLFGSIDSGGMVQNLGVEDADISDSFNTGGVAGMNSGTVQNCYVTGTVSGSRAGGVVGYNNGIVQDCYSVGNISGNDRVGGVVGYNYDGTIENCYSTGTISGGNFTGGVAGDNSSGIVKNCYSTGDISGGRTGGVAGYNNGGTVQDCHSTGTISGSGSDTGGIVAFNSSGIVENCYSSGDINGSSKTGGIVGYSYGNAAITNCYSTGDVSGNYTGGIVGDGSGSVAITNCYSTGNISGSVYVGGVAGSNGGTMQDCHSTGDVSGGTAGGVAGYNNGGTMQDCYSSGDVSGSSSAGGVAGSNGGTMRNCYSTGNVSSIGGGSAGGVAGSNGGTMQNCYSSGDVSGNGYTGGVAGSNSGMIEDCYSTGDVTGGSGVHEYDYTAGVVAYNIGGTVQNCHSAGTINGNDWIGGVVGMNSGNGTAQNRGIVRNCYSTGDVSGNNWIGGVAASNDTNSIMQNCYSTGNVSGSGQFVGGVAGRNVNMMQNCYSSGNVSGGDYTGGVVGLNSSGIVENCYSTGDVSGGDYTGGVVGNTGGSGSIIVQNCYSTGSVSGGNYTGGVAGIVSSGTIQNCAALNQSISGVSNIGRVTGSTGGVITGNYAYSGMVSGDFSPGSGPGHKNGADVDEATYKTEAFWRDTLAFNFISGPWVWDASGDNMPSLDGVGIAQPWPLH